MDEETVFEVLVTLHIICFCLKLVCYHQVMIIKFLTQLLTWFYIIVLEKTSCLSSSDGCSLAAADIRASSFHTDSYT